MKGRPVLEHPNINAAQSPTAIDGTPECPPSLKGEARQVWDAMTPLLAGAGVLDLLCAPILKRYCVVSARLEKAERALQRGVVKRGKGVKGKSGGREMHRSPHLIIANQCIAQLEALEKSLGIDPVARRKMGIEPKRIKGGLSVRDRSKSTLPPPKQA